eukprot:m51a1_g12259 hypothetical protein (317) ;mRNA; f:177938-178888
MGRRALAIAACGLAVVSLLACAAAIYAVPREHVGGTARALLHRLRASLAGSVGRGCKCSTPAAVPQSSSGVPGVGAVYLIESGREGRAPQMLALLRALGVGNVTRVAPYDAAEMQRRHERGEAAWDTPADTQLDLRLQGALNARAAAETEHATLEELWRMTARYYTALRALRLFGASGHATALFLADDMDLDVAVASEAERAVRAAPEPWSMLQLDACDEMVRGELVAAPGLHRSTSLGWCGAFVLNRGSLGGVLGCLDAPAVAVPDLAQRLEGVCSASAGWNSLSLWPPVATHVLLRPQLFPSARKAFGIPDPVY